jgi:predicted aspartyl protease
MRRYTMRFLLAAAVLVAGSATAQTRGPDDVANVLKVTAPIWKPGCTIPPRLGKRLLSVVEVVGQNMSMFRVNVTARNTKHEELATNPVAALVDTGSELTWLPADILKSIGITARRKRIFVLANRQRIQRDVGYALLSTEGYETVDEVVFAEPGDMSILGVRTIEGFGVMVDNIGHRFVTNPTIVALVKDSSCASSRSDTFSRP